MSSIVVRPFRRSDRDQLTQLVNTHAGAVVPGMSVSVSTVLDALERQPGEFIEDPWVSERMTLVADSVTGSLLLLTCSGISPMSGPERRRGTSARFTGCCSGPRLPPGIPAGWMRRRQRMR